MNESEEHAALTEICGQMARIQYHVTRQILRDKTVGDHIRELITKAQESVHHFIQMFSQGECDCRAGCDFCCYITVAATPLEAINIGRYLRQDCAPDHLDRIRDKLTRRLEETKGLTFDEQTSINHRCALLSDDHLCMVYLARPLKCAGWHSYSRQKCEEVFKTGSMRSGCVPVNAGLMSCVDAAYSGLSRGLLDEQLDGHVYELNSAVLIALDDPETERKWLNGESVFAGCTPAPSWNANAGTSIHSDMKVGRNDPCPCRSGKKYKKCCMKKRQ